MKPRIIVCGLGRTGYKIFCLLRQQGAIVVGISDRPLRCEGSDVIVGNLQAASSLLAAGIQNAHTLVLAGDDDAVNLAILMQARILNPKIRIINRLFNTSLGDRLDHTLPEHTTMSVSSLAAPVFSFAALGNQAIGQLRLFNQTWPIHEEYIDENHAWKGRKLRDLWEDRSRMLIYYLPADNKIDLVSAVLAHGYLQQGDRLIIATQPSVRSRRKTFTQKLLKILTNLRRLQQQTQSAVSVSITLLLIILAATFTYTTVNFHVSIVDAFYFSVGMITGAGGNDKVVENAPDSIKIFTVVMMLVGAGMIGLFYALLNDFILGTRLREYWDAARIPQRNHYIICGLGGIGVQIAKQLQANGHEVAVIDSDSNNRFLSTARSLKIPVIQGDASLSSILEEANIKQAEALLAVTSSDMSNLEIALSAKGLAPKLPVIVRNQDPHFALMVQQVFEFEAVLSPTEIAAPAFAAAAIGGRIFGNGMTLDSLWVALATLITPGHPFCGQRIQDAAMSADFVPLYAETNCQTIHGWDLLNFYLSAGDVLYLTMPANRLEQLWRSVSTELIRN
ncbi:NAD-binding protein [Kamptonema animale CS-326]|jgi:Trk K+ transport system NAD-binding subunit|uniref:potassium channel family protein n=1 Tax=Kamptonema animale TaxID=92934 RepID=UPI00232BDD88|nr:NAD-binding protein [Kamptonema animale]MDB9515320.1 NAD-binding protein [Kamptonema animale CS-326]